MTADSAGEVTLRDAVGAEQVRLLYADGGVALVTTFAASVLLASLLVWQRAMAPLAAGIWLAFMALHTVARLVLQRAYLRARPGPEAWRAWAHRFVAGTMAGGLTWGAGIPWLLPPGRLDLQWLVIGLLVSGTYGIISSAGAYLPAFYTFILPIVPLLLWLLAQGDTLHLVCAAIVILWLPTVAVLGRRYNASLVEALQLRFENAALARAAEQANLAKSRFLASASHDLRQPIHALGMFVGALRGHALPPRSAELVEHMDGSIAGLDGLFTALLDVSRLDAGVIESRPEAVDLQPMLARIRRDVLSEAEAKGVRLTFVPTKAWVVSDPMLLERVMRNLIGNTVRYTDRGRVLVGCRRRDGRIALEVWDTGRGIAPEQREAIFEDFYQVAGKTSDSGRMGLGLGLAIVRRLTGILDHPLTLDSELGRGSVFQVLAPRSPAPRPVAELAAAPAPANPASALILAVDDESAVRTAMAELLASWGHRTVPASSGAAALAALAGAAPDLIVCDYSLRGGETGLETIARLQAAFGVRIPAILVTGETAPDRLRAAEAGGYPLLHKPLTPTRLRAAVTGQLRRAATPSPTVAAE
ncbi:hybrid sensor histidine kinase/response regulator [Phenylobacterium sp.]|uniref:ATP-binding response regulator n=1 Tax=Phenylobacterium sp. TaxID=1871053 RepID=UPI0025DFE0C9|nr:hybrid sensor histidine kinase/response regulator [Phenylobacterium sp.]